MERSSTGIIAQQGVLFCKGFVKPRGDEGHGGKEPAVKLPKKKKQRGKKNHGTAV
jgi:hypothetical protein